LGTEVQEQHRNKNLKTRLCINEAAIKLLHSSAQLDRKITRQESRSTCASNENKNKTESNNKNKTESNNGVCDRVTHPFEHVEDVVSIFDALSAG
jgi:hypothetical protein